MANHYGMRYMITPAPPPPLRGRSYLPFSFSCSRGIKKDQHPLCGGNSGETPARSERLSRGLLQSRGRVEQCLPARHYYHGARGQNLAVSKAAG